MKKIYFISDLHLGAKTMDDPLSNERRVVRFLDSIKEDCEKLFLLGDVIDYWFEFKHVVPKGFTRFLGKLGELTDRGIEVHWFTGNHDIWIFGYIQQETGAIVHTHGEVMELQGKKVYMAHGDGLGDDSKGYKLMSGFFHSRVAQWFFRWIHPDITTGFALGWSKKSRVDGIKELEREHAIKFPEFMGEDKEFLVIWAKQYIKEHPDTDYLLFGHRHIMLDLMLSRQSRMMILGDWVHHFSYAVMEEGQMCLDQFELDESLYETEQRQGVSIAIM